MTTIDFQIKLLEIELEYCPQNWIAKEEIKKLKEYKEKHKKVLINSKEYSTI